jgi:hypothetical protein
LHFLTGDTQAIAETLQETDRDFGLGHELLATTGVDAIM